MRSLLNTPEAAEKVKKFLWSGLSQDLVARKLQLSQSFVSRISRGIQFVEIPWPDGSFGPFPTARRIELLEKKDTMVVNMNILSPEVKEALQKELTLRGEQEDEDLDASILAELGSPSVKG